MHGIRGKTGGACVLLLTAPHHIHRRDVDVVQPTVCGQESCDYAQDPD